MTLRDRVQTLARERNLTLSGLEKELKFGNGTIVKWDICRPNVEKLEAVAKYFDVSIDYLMNGKECSASIAAPVNTKTAKTLRDRVQTLARERNLTLSGLEKELGFGNATIVKWDKRFPSVEKLEAVAKYFDVSGNYLLYGEEHHTRIAPQIKINTNDVEENSMIALKDRLEKLAHIKNVSLTTLESELGFENSTIVKCKKCFQNAEKLNAVAKYFGVSMDYLMNGEELPNKEAETNTDENEQRLLALYKKAAGATPEMKKALVDNFESLVNVYLQAREERNEVTNYEK